MLPLDGGRPSATGAGHLSLAPGAPLTATCPAPGALIPLGRAQPGSAIAVWPFPPFNLARSALARQFGRHFPQSSPEGRERSSPQGRDAQRLDAQHAERVPGPGLPNSAVAPRRGEPNQAPSQEEPPPHPSTGPNPALIPHETTAAAGAKWRPQGATGVAVAFPPPLTDGRARQQATQERAIGALSAGGVAVMYHPRAALTAGSASGVSATGANHRTSGYDSSVPFSPGGGIRRSRLIPHFAAGRRRAKRDGRAAAYSPCPASRGAWQNLIALAAPERWHPLGDVPQATSPHPPPAAETPPA